MKIERNRGRYFQTLFFQYIYHHLKAGFPVTKHLEGHQKWLFNVFNVCQEILSLDMQLKSENMGMNWHINSKFLINATLFELDKKLAVFWHIASYEIKHKSFHLIRLSSYDRSSDIVLERQEMILVVIESAIVID